jgi:hypothetical protein
MSFFGYLQDLDTGMYGDVQCYGSAIPHEADTLERDMIDSMVVMFWVIVMFLMFCNVLGTGTREGMESAGSRATLWQAG